MTLSVRFTGAEIATIRSRAAAAGFKPTTYIRQCVLAAEQPPIDRARIARIVDALSRDLDDLRQAASPKVNVSQ
ncbi:MAG: plasmid mobilization protein [Nocardioidaceae bacterium]